MSLHAEYFSPAASQESGERGPNLSSNTGMQQSQGYHLHLALGCRHAGALLRARPLRQGRQHAVHAGRRQQVLFQIHGGLLGEATGDVLRVGQGAAMPLLAAAVAGKLTAPGCPQAGGASQQHPAPAAMLQQRCSRAAIQVGGQLIF